MISVPIRYRRADRALFIQKLQHAVPSIVVLSDGLTHLTHEPRGLELVLGVFEVAAALGVMTSVVHGFRKTFTSSHQHEGPLEEDRHARLEAAARRSRCAHAGEHFSR